MDKEKKKKKNRIWAIIVLIIFFIINGWKFLNSEGSDKPLPISLFNMIFYLGIIVLLLHNNTIERELGNNTLDKYFKFK